MTQSFLQDELLDGLAHEFSKNDVRVVVYGVYSDIQLGNVVE